MDTGKIILGVLGGMAAGVVLGVLFAPAKGADTRKKILETGEGYADDISEKFNAMIEDFTKQIETVKAEILHTTENGKAKMAETVEAAKHVVSSK